MMKLHDRQMTPVTTEHLPQMPAGVTVPDDISTIEHPASGEQGPPGHKVRWLFWVPVLLLVAATAVVVGLALRDDGNQTADTPSSYELVQESIDQALAAQQVATVDTPSSYELVQESIDQALAAQQVATVDTPSSYQLVQESIDQALAAQQVATVDTPSSYELVQESIDQALAAQAALAVTPATPSGVDGNGWLDTNE